MKAQTTLILAAGLLAGTAVADIVRITAVGTVNSSNMGAFSTGQTMTAVIEYETAGPPQLILNQQAFYVDHITHISFSSGEWDTSDTGAFGQINKYDNLANGDGISLQVASHAQTYQFTNPKPEVVNLDGIGGSEFRNVHINFASFSQALWDNYDLPGELDFSDFDRTQNAGFSFNNGSFGVGWHTVQSEIVPAPGVLALIGLSGFTSMRRRR